jgi:hypothetical protein
MLNDDFDKCTNLRRLRNANYLFECKKGLWSVECSSLPKARREAAHYFEQYKSDGEYSDTIGGHTVLEVMKKLNT